MPAHGEWFPVFFHLGGYLFDEKFDVVDEFVLHVFEAIDFMAENFKALLGNL